MNIPFFLVGVGSGLGAGVAAGAGREDSSQLSPVSSSSPLKGTGGIYLQFPSLFAPYDVSKCEFRYQW